MFNLTGPVVEPQTSRADSDVLTGSVGSFVKRTLSVGGGLGFDSRAGQIGHSVSNGSPPMRRFFEAVLSRR